MRKAIQWRALFLPDADGNTIVEFALILPAFVMVVVGGIYAALLGFSAASMQYAVQAGARCASLGTTCSDSATTIAYTKQQFFGVVGATPVFTVASPACGHQVNGTLTMVVKTGLKTINVPLNSSACFP